jgi:ABC-type bacteriocin/lantibiotic exporter with double-glycine peptidase domain
MVLAYYGIEKSEPELIEVCNCSVYGTDPYDLVVAARTFGFNQTAADHLDWEELRSATAQKLYPIVWLRTRIAPTDIKPPIHSVVLLRTGKRVTMHDPVYGSDYTLARDVFLQAWELANWLTVVLRK